MAMTRTTTTLMIMKKMPQLEASEGASGGAELKQKSVPRTPPANMHPIVVPALDLVGLVYSRVFGRRHFSCPPSGAHMECIDEVVTCEGARARLYTDGRCPFGSVRIISKAS